MNDHELTALTGRAQQLIGAVSEALMSTAESAATAVTGTIKGAVDVAAERIRLASELALLQQRMAAFGSVLEAIHAQRQALRSKLHSSDGALAVMIGHQLSVLQTQEFAVLVQAGVGEDVARAALSSAEESQPGKLYERDGSRFRRLNGSAQESQ